MGEGTSGSPSAVGTRLTGQTAASCGTGAGPAARSGWVRASGRIENGDNEAGLVPPVGGASRPHLTPHAHVRRRLHPRLVPLRIQEIQLTTALLAQRDTRAGEGPNHRSSERSGTALTSFPQLRRVSQYMSNFSFILVFSTNFEPDTDVRPDTTLT